MRFRDITWGTGSVDNTDLLLGASVPFGANTLLASYIRKDDKSSANKGAHQLALTLTHAFSSRTIGYLSGARVSNKNGANYHTFGATLPTATQSGAVAGTREVNIGLRHAF